MTVREYSFDRFRWALLSAEQKGARSVRETVMVAIEQWRKDYRLLAAMVLFMFQRWQMAAAHQQYDLSNTYGPMMELICNVTARRNLCWEEYQAFSRLMDNPFNMRYQDAIND